MVYYVENDNKIIIYSNKKHTVENTLRFEPEYAGLPILKSNKTIVEFDGGYYFEDDEEYLAKKEAKEEERIQELSMTRSDFFDATIKAWGVDGNELLPVVKSILETLPISEIEKKIAINNYENALNFYRKHTLFTLLSGVPITIGEATIVVTKEQWDSFFDKTDKKDPDAYKELLPS